MRNFRTLKIWKEGIELVKMVYKVVDKLPTNERFGLRSQMTRSAVSVPSNIAEGCSRNSEIEFKRFLEIAIGSLFELETQLIIALELNMIDETESKDLIDLIQMEERMINGLINKIVKSR